MVERRKSKSAARPAPALSEYKQAQCVLASVLFLVCLLGCALLDQKTLTGNRIFMPVLTILLTSANESVYGVFEVSEEKGLTKRAITAVATGTMLSTFASACFGVPLTRILDTINWAFFFSSLCLMPGACFLSSDWTQWKRVYLLSRPLNIPERICCTLLYAPMLGAWLGAWVVPLDWRRTWQAWPIPCFAGALLGYFAGTVHLVISFVQAERRMPKPSPKPVLQAADKKKLPVCNESNWWMFM